MKRIWIFLILLLPVWAIGEEKVLVDIYSQPNSQGSTTFASFGYQFGPLLASFINVKYDNLREDSDIGVPDSLLVTHSEDLELDFYFLQYNILAGNRNELKIGFGSNSQTDENDLKVAIGFNIHNQEIEEKGYFVSGPAEIIESATLTNQVYENTLSGWFYSPKIQVNAQIKTENLNLGLQIIYAPVFWYSYEQKIFIRPLVDNGKPYQFDFNENGSNYFYSKLKLFFFNFLELQGDFEYYRMDFKQLNLALISTGPNVYSFSPVPSNFEIKNYTVVLNIRPQLFSDVDLVFGVGKKFVTTLDLKNDRKTVDRENWILNLGAVSKF